jgi:hypothetical protein
MTPLIQTALQDYSAVWTPGKCANFMSVSVSVSASASMSVSASASVSVTVSMSMTLSLSVRKALFFFSFKRRYEYIRRLGNCLDNSKGSYEAALKLKEPPLT